MSASFTHLFIYLFFDKESQENNNFIKVLLKFVFFAAIKLIN